MSQFLVSVVINACKEIGQIHSISKIVLLSCATGEKKRNIVNDSISMSFKRFGPIK